MSPWILAGIGAVTAAVAFRNRGPSAEFYAVNEGDEHRDCIPPYLPAPPLALAGYRALTPYLRLVRSIVGDAEVRSWWRPGDCNDGAPRSRHLEGWAIDLRVTHAQTRILRDWIAQTGDTARSWGDYVRSAIGTDRRVGLRIYPSGNLHIDLGCPEASAVCDPRRSDWLDIAPRWR